MNEFVIPEVRNTVADTVDCVFPLERAVRLRDEFARVFSQHLGSLESGSRFETESILVTGQSGSGKTKEIAELLKRFNSSEIPLPSGRSALFAECILTGTQGWKDLGRNTIRAIGYPLDDRSRSPKQKSGTASSPRQSWPVLSASTMMKHSIFSARRATRTGLRFLILSRPS
ncbi:hypothetical protein [Pontivivens nitratireducens]|uniref:hypothetical protein n=1 Tax=Pontivivens nitratireducens TaxID=2758038 RepID=UPI001F113DF4|nr:hypothetical protein [Pontibrevibacter nitratireducens]